MITSIATLRPEECAPVPDAGLGALVTERGNLPLESVDVTAAVSGLIAGVEVVQGFRNPHDVALEATYVFPLPDRAAVTAFRMEADGRVIEGVLKERGQARADYDQAICRRADGPRSPRRTGRTSSPSGSATSCRASGSPCTSRSTSRSPTRTARPPSASRWSSPRATSPAPRSTARRRAPAGRPTPTRSPTPPGSRRRCCCPASPTRCGSSLAVDVDPAGLELARGPLQPARGPGGGRQRDPPPAGRAAGPRLHPAPGVRRLRPRLPLTPDAEATRARSR